MYEKTIISELDYSPSVKVWDDEPHLIVVDQGYSEAVYPIEEAREMIKVLTEAVAYADSQNTLKARLDRLDVGRVIRWSNDAVWIRAVDGWRKAQAAPANIEEVNLWDGLYTFEVIV